MRWTKTHIETFREAPAEAEIVSHQLAVRAGLIKKVATGLFTYQNLALRSLRRIERIIREELNARGGIEVLMPVVHPRELWEASGRWESMGPALLKFQNRHKQDLCLGATHEEVVVDLMRHSLKSYRDLPKNIYQIQTKFRDEMRPRFGVMRGREFIMKDAYTFDADTESALRNYELMREAYTAIFTRMGFRFRTVQADPGQIGGQHSQEFHILADSGEDALLVCEHGAFNVEVVQQAREGDICPECHTPYKMYRGIEVGHIFYLGTKYSKALEATYSDKQGQSQWIEMGCYGIGVSRILQAAIEQSFDENGIIWPAAIAPYDVHICQLDDTQEVQQVCAALEQEWESRSLHVLIDDRTERPGVKFKDADLIGIPWRVVVGKRGLANNKIEVCARATKENRAFVLKSEKTSRFQEILDFVC